MNRLLVIQIAAAALIAGAVVAGSQLLRPAAPPSCDPTRDIFIVRDNWVRTDGPTNQVVLSKFDPNATPSDVQLGTISGYSLLSGYDRAGRIFLRPRQSSGERPAGTPDSLHEYEICTGRQRSVLTLPEGARQIDSARYVGDSATLLVVTSEITDEPAAKRARLEVYRDGARILSAGVSEQSPMYAGVWIDGMTPDGEVAYLRESGGDGGDIWGSYYRWQRKTNALHKLGSFTGGAHDGTVEYMVTDGYYYGALNPSATFAIRVQRGKFDKIDLGGPNAACINETVLASGKYDAVGEELVLRDMSAGEDRVIYRNRTRVKTSCLDDRAVIISPTWQDDRHVAFILPDGIHTIDVRTGNAKLLTPLEPKRSPRAVTLNGANDEYLFTRVGYPDQSRVVHRTGKIVIVPSVNPGSGVHFLLPAGSAFDDS